MATITLKAGMVWKGAYDASVTYDKLDVVYNADKTQIAVCKQGGSGIPLTNSNYWEVSIDASGIIALLEDALAHGEIYTMKIGSVTTGASSSATIVNNHQTHETILNLVLEKGEKGEKGDKGDRGEKGDTTVIDPSTATTYTLYNQTGKHTDGAMTQDAVTKEFGKLDETYARNDGYYESMGVGMATNLKGQNVVDAEFAYRKSGGNVEVQDGNAMIEAIKGNTIAWNQLIQNGDFSSGVGSWTCGNTVLSVSNNILTLTLNGSVSKIELINFSCGQQTANHVYAHFVQINPSRVINTAHKSYQGVINNIPANTWTNYVSIISSSQNNVGIYDLYMFSSFEQGDTVLIKNIMFFDLTLIYGEGKEPSTPEQFEQDYFMWFGKPLTYEPYDAGSLRNTKVSALKTVEFNLWDEEWEVGSFDTTTGVNLQSSGQIRSKNYIPVLSNKEYHCFFSNTVESKSFWMMFFDKNKNVLSDNVVGSIGRSNNVSDVLNVTFTTPNDCCYIRFYTKGTTYNHDICINLSDPNRNGEYEPYKESTLPLDVTTLTGKLNGEGSSVVVFADGMNSAGNVYDEICVVDGVTKAIKRVSSSHEVLAEPEVYVLDDFNLPKLYPVANGGTEEQLSNYPNSLPATLSIRYGLNAAAFIQNAPKNYISKESMSNFLSNLGSAMGGTWSINWNSSTNKYDFTFTQNRSVEPVTDNDNNDVEPDNNR